MRLYVACWLLVAVLALSGGGALVLAVHLRQWPDAALDAFYLALAAGLGWHLRAHPPLD